MNNFGVKSARHTQAIENALSVIRRSELAPYVRQVLLYGSCARGEEKWGSDIDLCAVLSEDSRRLPRLSKKICLLKGSVSGEALDSVDIDIKILIGDDWVKDGSMYCENLRREGVNLWQ